MESRLNRRRLFGLLAAGAALPFVPAAPAPAAILTMERWDEEYFSTGSLVNAQQEINRRRSVAPYQQGDLVWNGAVVRELP